MKKMVLLAMLAVVATGCRSANRGVVVQETFLHKYGVPVTKDDWVRNGRDGAVVELRKDGVTVTRTYNKGVLDGKTTYTFPHSSIVQISETFDKGELVSKVENYLSGIPMKEEKFQGTFVSSITRWYEDGIPSAEEFYENGYIVKGEYKTPLNVIESEIVDGEGTRILRGGEGELLAKESVKNKETIERIAFFPNGDPSSITPYEHGLIHGTRLTFLPGGLPNTVEEWVHGHQEGITVVYINGEKASEITYARGEKHGAEHRFRDGKMVVEEITWRHGVQHGPRTLLSETGTTLQTEWYHEGELVSRPTYERMNLR